MKPFFFHLESVLSLRAREEERAQDLNQRAEETRRCADRDLQDARAELSERIDAVSATRASRLSLSNHMLYLNAVSYQRVECERLAGRLNAAIKEIEKLRNELMIAHRKHRAVLQLKERHRRAHEAEQARREEQEVNDLITSRHSRALCEAA